MLTFSSEYRRMLGKSTSLPLIVTAVFPLLSSKLISSAIEVSINKMLLPSSVLSQARSSLMSTSTTPLSLIDLVSFTPSAMSILSKVTVFFKGLFFCKGLLAMIGQQIGDAHCRCTFLYGSLDVKILKRDYVLVSIIFKCFCSFDRLRVLLIKEGCS